MSRNEHDAVDRDADVAIIGMAGRFPGAGDVESFWRNLREGVESIARFAPEEIEPSPLMPPALRGGPGFVPAGAVLGDADRFDHDFFGVPPAEAQLMDPQLRVFLECAWAALEDAGYDPQPYPGKIALYAGAGITAHLLSLKEHLTRSPAALFEAVGAMSAGSLAMRVAHKLGLKGESVTVYTACSTGLVAVHLACQSLLLRQADMALAGGVRVSLPERTGYVHQEGMIFSPDGRCRAFDHRAQGTVVGHGAGVVALKLLGDAIRDGDHIHAVIRGSAINNDGADKVGFTAPGVAGQLDVILQALSYADVDPATIGYVEAHGTGTALGDPIEIEALTRAFRRSTERRGYCALGSVKTNIGHLDTAAGVTGLIKAALALAREEIPPSLHFERPNPRIDLDASPFFVNTALRPWPRGEAPRRAAVSSFGIGGTNAHAVLEEAPAARASRSRRGAQLVVLSARTPAALAARAAALAAHLERRPELEVDDVAFTLAVGRRAFAHRRALVARDRDELLRALGERPAADAPAPVDPERRDRPNIALLFPGQGSQSVGMGGALYEAEPAFRRDLDESCELLRATLGLDLRDALYPAPDRREEARRMMSEPELALPALLAVQHALARLWEGWGFTADALLGHSFGEYAAACLAGVLSREDALRAAIWRGRLVARLPEGRMLAVALPEAQLAPWLTGALALAAVNARERCVASGPPDEIDALERRLGELRIPTARLPVRRAFHSPMVEPILEDLRGALAGVHLRAPARRYVSSLSGTWIQPEQATDPAYWAAQARAPVRFAAGLDALVDAGCGFLIEAGPDQALCALARAHLGRRVQALPSLPRADRPTPEHATLLRSLGALWAAGHEPDWRALYAHEQRRRVSLPSYPFEGPRFPAAQGRAAEPAPPSARGAPDQAASAGPRPFALREAGVDEAPPRTTEQRVAAIWGELLGVAEVGLHDDFLELGGNSLLAAQALTRLRDAFRVEIPLSDLFEATTVSQLAAQIEARLGSQPALPDVSPTRAALLPPVPAPPGEARPLSCVQERVWALEQRHPGDPALNMPISIRITGRMDLPRLEDALEAVVRRHEALRTTYRAGPAGPAAVIVPALRVPLTVEDLAALPEPDRRRRAAARAAEEAAQPFDLTAGPVLRAAALRLGPEEHLLLLTVHHIASDTTTLLVIGRELAAAYDALSRGERPMLPELPIQYADFAAWQRRALSDGALADQLATWRARLAGMPSLGLPTDRSPPAEERLHEAHHAFVVPAQLSRAVAAFGQRRGMTPFVTWLAAWGALLGRLARQTDVVIGTPLGNRSRPELAPLVGYVAHAAALRLDLSGAPSFAALAARARAVALEAQEHADVPFEALAPEIGRTRLPGRARLFDAAFVLHGAFVEGARMPGVSFRLEDAESATQFGATLANLSLNLREGEDGLAGTIDYNPDLFDGATVARMAGDLAELLEGALARPEEPLSGLGPPARAAALPIPAARADRQAARPLEFSLFYFAADDDAAGGDKYRLMLEGARRADRLGFSAVWTPERHFHPFGGMYPNPAVTGAALAAITERVRIRAGSVVLPLHHPVRVAEEWAVVDNLSGGRIGVAFASGWHVRDFVLAPGQYAGRRELMRERIEIVRRLWRGEEIRLPDGAGGEAAVSIRPRPVQPELPFWITSGGSVDTFRLAGELGAGLLTNLMGQRLEDLAAKIAAYREAFRQHGHGPGRGHVTLMLHAFLGPELEGVRRAVRGPLLAYLRSSLDVMRGFAQTAGLDGEALTARDMEALVEHGFDRYLHAGGLFGTPESCRPLAERVRDLDVDELACLIDFGADAASVLSSLEHLAALMRSCNEGPGATPAEAAPDIPRGRAAPIAPPPITPADRGDDLPLSFVQQRLWYLDQLVPGNPAYNNAVALRMSGPLDVPALERSLNEVIARHEALRTAFPTAPSGAPTQRIAPSLHIPVPLEDLSHRSAAERGQEAARRAAAVAREPFDLSRLPLVRASLFRLGEREHVLVVVMHHIVSDGWSAGVLLTELSALYGAFSRGQGSPLPPLPVQYADYAVWQRRWLRGEALEAALAHFRGALAGKELVLDLPTDRPRPPVMSARGARRPIVIRRELVDRIAAFSRQERATPFMTLLAAFAALLHRYTGQGFLAIGTPTAGRSRPELERLVGCFINTLVIGADVSGDPSFRRLLSRVRRAALDAYTHQELPFERLVDELQPERDLSRTPLVQAMLSLHHIPALGVEIGELALESLPVDTGAAKLDLVIELQPSPEGLSGALEYNVDLFDPGTAARMAAHLMTMLEAALGAPDAPISALPLVDAGERRRLLSEWNDTRAAYPDAGGVHRLFLAQAARSPEAPAVIAEDGRLSYGELERRSGRLAVRLRRLGVGPGQIVGLHLGRSMEAVVAILGVLRAGGAYVPLDPSYPAERLRWMAEDAGVALVVSRGAAPPELAGVARALDLSRSWDEILAEPGQPPDDEARPEDLAYVIYTSGSTGRPKGVAAPHRGVCNLAASIVRRLGVEPAWRVLQIAPLAFDGSVFELWMALAAGAALVIAPEGTLPGEDLHALLRAHEVTAMATVPSALSALPAEDLPALRMVLSAGEACTPEVVRRWAAPGRRIWNGYGPTEATVNATLFECSADVAGPPPIGRPLDNVRAYVLDARGEPAPVGVPGELWVGGAGVAAGYLRRPALTAERFVPDPFCAEPGARMYRTGDRVRRRADGHLEFLGRRDDQIKLRGHRIELGEVEAALTRHPAVREAAAAVREDRPGSPRLVAYVVAAPGAAPTGAALQAHLGAHLPGYMIPSAFVALDALPRLPSGKIDRRALPSPDPAPLDPGGASPRTPLEELVARLFRETLRLDRVGIHDSFFDLGGDSILSIQLVSRARQAGLSFSPRQLVGSPTVAALASAAAAHRPAQEVEEEPGAGPIPLTPIQRWFFEREPADPHHFNLAALLDVPGDLDAHALQGALDAVVQHHEVLRLRFTREGGSLRQEVTEARAPRVERIDLSSLPAPLQDEALAAAAARIQADLSLDGPLLRLARFHLGARGPAAAPPRDRLLLVVHHLVVDAVSLAILLEDLDTAYRRLAAGEPPSLPARTTSLRRWAERLAAEASSPAALDELELWRSLPWHRAARLPVEAGPGTEAEAASVRAALDAEETLVLLREAPRALCAEVQDLLLFAMARVLCAWTERDVALFDVEGHGREPLDERLDLSRTVGWFTSMYPVALELPEASTPGDIARALGAMKAQLRRIPRRGLGFGVLRHLAGEDTAASLRALPPREVVFNYLGQLDPALAQGALLRWTTEPAGPLRSGRAARSHHLEVAAFVRGGRLEVDWRHSTRAQTREAVSRLADRFLDEIRALLALARSPRSRAPAGLTLADHEIEDVYPLTPMQACMLAEHDRGGAPRPYLVQCRLDLGEALDLTAFERAWQELFARHPALRSSFHLAGAGVQVVHARVPVPLERHDLTGLPAEAQAERIAAHLEAEQREGLRPDVPPPMRLALFRRHERDHHLVWTFHHVALDGWSVGILLRELFALHDALSGGAPAPLAPPRPFRDFVAWLEQRSRYTGEQRLRRVLEQLTPTALGRTPFVSAGVSGVGGAAGAGGQTAAPSGVLEHRIPPPLTAALASFARRHDLTMGTLVQAAWAIMLARRTGQDRVAFGLTVAGRPPELPGIEATVGLFVDVLPLVVELPPGERVLSWLTRLHEQQTELAAHAHTTLPELRRSPASPGAAPLLESNLRFQSYPIDRSLLSGRLLGAGGAGVVDRWHHPLDLAVVPGEALEITAQYARDRFQEDDIARLLDELRALLAALVNVERGEHRLGDVAATGTPPG